MAKKQATQTDVQNEVATILNQIETSLTTFKALGMSDADLDATRKKLMDAQTAPIRSSTQIALMDAATAIVQEEEFKAKVAFLHGATFGVSIAINDLGEVTVMERQTVRSAGTRRSPSGGKRGVVICDDQTYEHWAALCAARDLVVKGDSARRVYNRAHEADPVTYPEAIQVDATEAEA